MEVTNKFTVVDAKCLGRFCEEETSKFVALHYDVESLISLRLAVDQALALLLQQLSAQPSQKETSHQLGVV